MSVHERLRELEADVQHLQVLPAAVVRDRGRSRGRRQLAGVTVAGAVVAVTAGVAFAWQQQQQQQQPQPQQQQVASGPTTPERTIACVLTLPGSPAEVRIRVLDGGAPAGVANETAAQLRARTFTVLDATTAPGPAGATELRYGPTAIGAATLLRAALHDEATMRFDPDRGGETIDLTLGPAFTRLATATEINQNLVAAGQPSPPAQCR